MPGERVVGGAASRARATRPRRPSWTSSTRKRSSDAGCRGARRNRSPATRPAGRGQESVTRRPDRQFAPGRGLSRAGRLQHRFSSPWSKHERYQPNSKKVSCLEATRGSTTSRDRGEACGVGSPRLLRLHPCVSPTGLGRTPGPSEGSLLLGPWKNFLRKRLISAPLPRRTRFGPRRAMGVGGCQSTWSGISFALRHPYPLGRRLPLVLRFGSVTSHPLPSDLTNRGARHQPTRALYPVRPDPSPFLRGPTPVSTSPPLTGPVTNP